MTPPGRPPSHKITRQSRDELAPSDEKEVVRALVAEELKKHTMGITVPLFAERIGIAATTARFHLEHLVAVGEAYRHDVGSRTVVYMPNGKLAHNLTEEPVQFGDKHYSFKLVSNAFGEFYIVQEREKDPWGVWKTKGGIALQRKALRQFAAKLERIADADKVPKNKEPTQ